jgi:hypothetical protein
VSDTLADVKRRMTEIESGGSVAPPPVTPTRRAPESVVKDMQTAAEVLSKAEEEAAARAESAATAAAKTKKEDDTPKKPTDGVIFSYRGFDTPDIRKVIEKRCQPMDFNDLLLSGNVRQLVPIIPGKVEVEFQSLTGKEMDWTSTYASRVAVDRGETSLFANTFTTWLQLTLSIYAFNGSPWASHMDKGAVDVGAALDKYKRLMAQPDSTLSLILTNFGWFNARVQMLYTDQLFLGVG